jgi:hypothetical protein
MPTPTSASQPRATHGVKVWLSGFVTALLLTGIAPAQAESPAGLPAGLPAGVSGADVATEGTAAAALPLPPVTVTVSIESITVLGGIDLSLTDSVVSIDWEEFTGAPVGDPVLDDTIRPGWTFTKEVDPARAVFNDLIPIRIEMNGVSPQFPFGRTLLDADPFACPGFPLGCAFEDINRPPSDDRGLDLWVDLVTGATLGNKATPGGSGSSCVSGTQTLAARVCFTVTRSHFTVPTTVPDDPDDPFNSNDPADPYDHVCHLHDCSLRQAVRDAGTPGTELRLPAGHYVLDRQLLFETPGVAMTGLPGGVVIEQTAADERVVEVDGPGDLEGVDPITIQGVTLIGGNSKVSGLRGHFHGGGVHNHGKLELQNVTITGNFAPGNVAAASTMPASQPSSTSPSPATPRKTAAPACPAPRPAPHRCTTPSSLTTPAVTATASSTEPIRSSLLGSTTWVATSSSRETRAGPLSPTPRATPRRLRPDRRGPGRQPAAGPP